LAIPDPVRPPEKGSSRRKVIILMAVSSFVLLVVLVSQAAFNLKFISPDSNRQLLFFAALTILIFLLFVALTFVLARNLLKLLVERRLGVIGSKFRTRMVVGALLLSSVPVIVMFLFSYGLMNRSIEKWFSRPVEEVREDTATMASLLSTYVSNNAQTEAQSIAESPEAERAFETRNFTPLILELRRHEKTLQGGFALAILNGDAEAGFGAPAAWQLLKPKLPLKDAGGATAVHFNWENKDYILGMSRVSAAGVILVGMPLPENFSATVQQIEASQARYLELSRERKLVRRTYMGLLLLLTVLVLFASTWIALFLSKLVTRPLAALAEGTQEISKGRLDYRVDVRATDEIGDLVRSFNRMAAELESGRRQIEASSHELENANAAIEQRRRHMETILESIPTGVLSLDADLNVTHVNAALLRMFFPDHDGTAAHSSLIGRRLDQVFPVELRADVEILLRRADRMGLTASQVEASLHGVTMNIATTAAALQHREQRLGYVVVFEDLSDLLKAQKQAAWREVARRVAHEIKNPLTPIALSAERIRRHLQKGSQPDEASLNVIHGCADTIGNAVDTLRALVDEFSTLARFPASQPQPASLNSIVDNALSMFNGRLDRVRVLTNLAPGLPAVMADAEAIKRAVANLVDNAAEAVRDSLVREIQISTSLVASRDAVELTVADTGHGVSTDLKERLFLPYFSTKKRGTGLGLAIVSRIIEEHHGSIRVEENKPVGAKFIVELPVATGFLSETAAS
jgi:two-component system, NtrC family, nitrogen regulation sensor histidine kinase NtrY